MSEPLTRREALRHLGVAGAGVILGRSAIAGGFADIMIAGQSVEIDVASLSAITVRITVRPVRDGQAVAVPITGELVNQGAGRRRTVARDAWR